MLLINGLKSSTASKNFIDFNNMFKAIDSENFTSTYIAILVIDKIKLERDPFRLNDVNVWFDEGHYPQHKEYRIWTSDDNDAESDVSDVSDISDISDISD